MGMTAVEARKRISCAAPTIGRRNCARSVGQTSRGAESSNGTLIALMATMVERIVVVLFLGLGSASCSGPAQQSGDKHAHLRPLSVEEHQAEAKRHDRVAQAEESAAASGSEQNHVRCGHGPIESPARVGGEPSRLMHPCFTSVSNPTADHRKEARENRVEARKHRNQAKDLAAAEARSCVGLDASALEHSPFSHYEDIQSIAPLREGDVTVGVTVVFTPIKGLDRSWLERSLKCHQARAASLGYPSDYMAPDCLTSIRGVEVAVTQSASAVHVDVRGVTGESAAAILGRALKLQARVAEKAR